MSLVRLLAAGKSLVGLNESIGTYRMANRRALPKFGSGKNPFREERAVEASPAGACGQVQVADKERSGGPNPPAPTGKKRTGLLPALLSPTAVASQDRDKSVGPKVRNDPGVLRPGTARERAQTTAFPAVSSKAVGPSVPAPKQLGRFQVWMNRWVAWVRRPTAKPARAMLPRFEKRPVQVELSLDRLKVVRNDLSDADLDVVVARRATPVMGSSKGRASERGIAGLFRANQS